MIQEISASEYARLTQDTTILATTKAGHPKVMKTAAGHVIKICYPHRFLNLFSYSRLKRFLSILQHLRQRDVPTIQPELVCRCPSLGLEFVTYPFLDGEVVRHYLKQGMLEIIPKFLDFLAELHQKNIYFRGGHMGNFLLQDNGRFALIDVSNMRFHVTLRRRARALAYAISHPEDKAAFLRFGHDKIMTYYLNAAQLTGWQKKLFPGLVRHYLKHFEALWCHR